MLTVFLSLLLFATTAIAVCPVQSEAFDDSCYFYRFMYATGITAQTQCRDSSSNLVSVHTPRENNYLYFNSAGLDFYLGGQRMNGVWQWNDGTAMDYTNWDEPPTADNGLDCIIMNGTLSGKWQPIECSDQFLFVCKRAECAMDACANGGDATCLPGFCSINAQCQAECDTPNKNRFIPRAMRHSKHWKHWSDYAV